MKRPNISNAVVRSACNFAKWAIAVVVLTGSQAWAEGPEAEAPGHEDAAQAESGAHEANVCQDHWSLVDVVMPAARHNLCGMLGKTYLNADPVARGMHVIMAGIVFLLAIFFALAARRALRNEQDYLLPQSRLSFFTFFELLTDALFGMMVNLMGEKKARQCFPLIGAAGVFILLSNLLGAIPGLLPPTDNLSTTLALGAVMFLATHYYGVKEHGIKYFKHFLGPIPWLAPLMLPIELISHFVRPASLAVRLMGNMFGDHAVLGIFLGFGMILVPLPIQLLGLIVAVVQTLVFCLLSMTYFALAVEHEEH